jgi:transcription antitermination factor NusG
MAVSDSPQTTYSTVHVDLGNLQDYDRPQWYVLYTSARHEKKVAELLGNRRVNSYLPLYRSVRRWRDRRKEIELPLFPSYVFVRIALRSRLQVLTVPGVVRLVTFDGKPASIADSEVDALRQGLSSARGIKPHPYLKVGKRVRVQSGPFAGMNGILVRRKKKYRLVLSIDLIMRSLSVEIDESEVEPAN